LLSLAYLLTAIYLAFNSFFFGNFLTGVLILAYLSGVIYYVYIKKYFFNGGGEGMFTLKTMILLFIVPLVFAYKFSSVIDKGPPDLITYEYRDGQTYCVYPGKTVNAKIYGGTCPAYKD
tara:strand:- start:140 stop:496 length:357 start_codon:yes stop_codon:yes gene_type:complete